MKDANVVKIANVAQEFEAAAMVAALGDAGINAVKQPAAGDKSVISLPGTMGIPENGFDILVSSDCEESAREILVGMGYDGGDECADISDTEEQPTDDTADGESAEEQPLSFFARFGLALLFLAGLTLFVWLCDYLIALVKGLF